MACCLRGIGAGCPLLTRAEAIPTTAAQLARSIGMPCLWSSSIKLSATAISSTRWLLTFPEECLTPETGDRAFAIAAEFLGTDLSRLRAEIPNPVALHLGCDGTGENKVRKVYLEAAADESSTVFLALKVRQGAAVLHRYTAVVAAEAVGLLHLPPMLQASCLDLLSVLPRNVAALLVQPEAGWRRSLDINLSDVVLTPQISAHIAAMVGRINPDFGPALPTAMTHIAVGMADDASPFVTLYGPPHWFHPDGDAALR
jgi:hypothetical protein